MIGGKVASYDDTRARNFPGVKTVVEFSGGVAVVANDYWTASKAVATLDVHWEGGPLSNSDQRSIWDGLESASQKPGAVFREHGDADAGMANAAKTVTAEYRLPFLSHSPMEPMNTTADVRADKAIIITPTQFQQLVPHVVAGVTGLKPEQVEVQTTFLGGGFGRRLEMDFVIAAAEISKAAGMPVKMVWSREEDMTHDAYRPAAILKFKAGLDSKGNLSAVQFHSTSPSITARMFPAFVKDGIDPFALEAIDNFPYAADAGLRFAYQMHDTGVKVGYWRAVSHNVNALAVESFMDELATTAGRDPLQYRMDMLDMTSTKHQWSGNAAGVAVGPRMRRALAQVQKKSGWGKNMPAGRGQGVAVMEGYNTVIAMVAEVTVSDTYDVQIDKITAVVDAGTLIHPDQALAQMQSCINFGQAACMYGEITFKDGTVQQDNFDTFRVTRINEAPKTLNIHFIKSNTTPGGLGEPGTAVVQPAIANAIFAATGKRVRTSPFTPENISAA
jgi:isoquinoline 1-oxidoreductase beta subunit